MQLTPRQIAEYTGGTIVVQPAQPQGCASGITWDSRAVSTGDLYVGLPGERVDGDDFAEAAIEAGAAAVMISRAPDEALERTAGARGAAIIQSADTARAVTDLAAGWRTHLKGRVLALTGSSGKTTTKNLIRDVLAAHGSVVATAGNQNNELGVPATLLRADEQTQAVIVEMGMRGAGQLESLCSFVKPDMALVTNIGESHIELLGSRENIAKAKAEVLVALPDGSGCAFINVGDDRASMICEYAKLSERGIDIVRFDGTGADPTDREAGMRPDVFASDIELDGLGRPSFTLHTPEGSARCRMQLRGLHNVGNACAAAAVGTRFGMDAATIAEALGASESMAGRARILRSKDGIIVVDDAYNANPDSMRASLAMFGALDVPGRRFAVLGDMFELGDFAPELHAEVGGEVADLDIDRLICVGDLARGIAAAAVAHGMDGGAVEGAEDAEEALGVLEEELQEGDAVLVKASHSMGLERIVKGLVG